MSASGAPKTQAGWLVSWTLPKANADHRRSEANAIASVCGRGVWGRAHVVRLRWYWHRIGADVEHGLTVVGGRQRFGVEIA